MTTRPLFLPLLPAEAKAPGVRQVPIAFQWFPGFAKVQQAKCLRALQGAIAQSGLAERPLEISTRSNDPYGVALSALNLELGGIPVERHYQAAKVYPNNLGPNPQWLTLPEDDLKAEMREFKARVAQQALPLLAFRHNGCDWPLTPPHAFYDWLYCRALMENPRLAAALLGHDGFTDLAFNPKRSFNSQAYAAALYVSLHAFGCLEEALAEASHFFHLHPNDPLIHPKCNAPSPRPQCVQGEFAF